FEQQKIINQGRRARSTFWQSANLREGANKLEKNSAYRQIVDDGITALEQHDKLTDPIDQTGLSPHQPFHSSSSQGPR
ncbi:MAG: biopolymer transport protein ExbB, partial [Frankiales bacterium]|nr:biopolymer transport protein ExbB [Frankiales bacterium]